MDPIRFLKKYWGSSLRNLPTMPKYGSTHPRLLRHIHLHVPLYSVCLFNIIFIICYMNNEYVAALCCFNARLV